MGDIKLDPVSQGYDYYGTVVNTAARVEGVAHGGQIAITAAVVEALTDGGRRTLEGDLGYAAHDFGPQPLRGLDEPIGLTQILPARFGDRVYAPLRLDVEIDHVAIHSDDEIADDAHGVKLATLAEAPSPLSPAGASDSGMAGRRGTSDFLGTVRSGDSDGGASAVSAAAGGGPVSAVDLIEHVCRRIADPALRASALEGTTATHVALTTMLAMSSGSWREATIAHLADKWRIAPLRTQPGMRRFRTQLTAEELDLVLLASRISTSAAVNRVKLTNAIAAQHNAARRRSSVGAPLMLSREPSAFGMVTSLTSGDYFMGGPAVRRDSTKAMVAVMPAPSSTSEGDGACALLGSAKRESTTTAVLEDV
jgi:hypothetical protein